EALARRRTEARAGREACAACARCGQATEGVAASRDQAGSAPDGPAIEERRRRVRASRHVVQRSGNWKESQFATPAFTAHGFSWAIKRPDRTTPSVRFRQSCRMGSARREETVSHV